MAFLNGLFALLSVVLFILLFVALIKPSIFKIKTRLKAFLIFCAAIIVCLVGFSVTMSDEEKARIAAENKVAEQQRKADEIAEAQKEKLAEQQRKADEKAEARKEKLAEQQRDAEQEVEVQPEKSLGLTVEQFRTKLNDEIIQADLETVKPLKQLKVEGNVFKVNNLANKNIGLVGKVNKNGEIESLVYIVGALKDSSDIATAMIYPGLTAKILSPEIQTEKKTKTLIKLMTKAAEGIDKTENFHKESIGGISYYSTASKDLGLWIGFEAEE
jgi:ATPase subunit of ABC transporter with duplicated ATPase domains